MPDKVGIDAPTWRRLMSRLLQKAMMAKDSTSACPQHGWKQVTAQAGQDVMTQVLKGGLAGAAANVSIDVSIRFYKQLFKKKKIKNPD